MLDGNILLQIFLLRTEENCTYLSNPLRCKFNSKRLTTTSDGDGGEYALNLGARSWTPGEELVQPPLGGKPPPTMPTPCPWEEVEAAREAIQNRFSFPITNKYCVYNLLLHKDPMDPSNADTLWVGPAHLRPR